MNDNFSHRVKNVINTGKQEAIRLKHSIVGTEHLLLGILKETEGDAIEILKELHIDFPVLQKKIENLAKSINSHSNISPKQMEQSIPLTLPAENALKIGRAHV